MQLIGILAALLIVGFLIYNQVGPGKSEQDEKIENIAETYNTPKVPTKPNEIEQFETDINNFMLDQAADRSALIEENTSQ